MTAVMTPTADRFAHREATRRMRINAGIRTGQRPEALADFGAAARRLRASNVWAGPDETSSVVVDVRDHAADQDASHRHAALTGRASSLLAAVADERARS